LCTASNAWDPASLPVVVIVAAVSYRWSSRLCTFEPAAGGLAGVIG
jgi:hypothetical protein